MGSTWKLEDHPKLPKGKIVAMVVLDGWGEAKPNKYNCIATADTPTMDSLKNVRLSVFLCVLIVSFLILMTHLFSCYVVSCLL